MENLAIPWGPMFSTHPRSILRVDSTKERVKV